jgi:hypothetical protein
MDNKEVKKNRMPVEQLDELEIESLLNKSRQELKELAKNLYNGKYQKNSRQREKIMQLLVQQLSSTEAAK